MVSKIMKKREIIFLTSFKSVHLYKTTFELFIKEVCNSFHNVYFVNIDNLVESKKTKNYNKKLFHSKKLFFNSIFATITKRIRINFIVKFPTSVTFRPI